MTDNVQTTQKPEERDPWPKLILWSVGVLGALMAGCLLYGLR